MKVGVIHGAPSDALELPSSNALPLPGLSLCLSVNFALLPIFGVKSFSDERPISLFLKLWMVLKQFHCVS
ncbi:uncharacterized protein J3R85_002691 [Psidium guajava]|nr:uncharacterized protein J3R85_002691 [Psidium guajava]